MQNSHCGHRNIDSAVKQAYRDLNRHTTLVPFVIIYQATFSRWRANRICDVCQFNI